MEKTIFITGAAGGFGQASADRFAAAGYYLGLFDLDESGVAELAARYGSDRCCHRRLDVTDARDCAAAVAYFGEHTGGTMHVLLNNAGIMHAGDFAGSDLAAEMRVIDVNLKGVMQVAHCAYPLLKGTPGARVINLGSAAVLHGNPELVAYSASKRAVNSFTESLDIGWAEAGIRVCDVNPMYARTPMMATHHATLRNLPEDKIRLTAEDVADAIFATLSSKKVHHYVGADTKFYVAAGKVLPFWMRRLVTRKILGY